MVLFLKVNLFLRLVLLLMGFFLFQGNIASALKSPVNLGFDRASHNYHVGEMSKFLGDNGFGSAYSRSFGIELSKLSGPASLASGLVAEKYGSKFLGRLSLGIGVYFLAQDVDYYLDANLQNQIIANHE